MIGEGPVLARSVDPFQGSPMTQREGILRRNLLLGLTLATLTEIVNSTPARAWLGYDFNDVNTLLRFNRQSGIRVLDAAGHFVGARGAYYAPPLEYEQMPRYLVLALVAQEDRCFFNDCLLRIGGLDLRAIGRAVIAAMKNGKASQGASTITQQVLKEIFLKEHNKYVRKVEEAALAPGLDLSLTKSDILFLYLNRVYFGAGAYGIEAASRVFFGKPAQHLGLTESVLLISGIACAQQLESSQKPKSGVDESREPPGDNARAWLHHTKAGYIGIDSASSRDFRSLCRRGILPIFYTAWMVYQSRRERKRAFARRSVRGENA